MSASPNQQILDELEKTLQMLGPWAKHLILGGGVALIVYDSCMAKANAHPVTTTDIDFLIPRASLKTDDELSLFDRLQSLGFRAEPRNLETPPLHVFVKDLDALSIEIEFLTDNRSRQKDRPVLVPHAEVVAQPLSYLEMGLRTTTLTSLPGGTPVKLVTPEAWVFHKGLTFPRRKSGSPKKLKDLYGIWFVLTQMGHFSKETRAKLDELQASESQSWRATFHTNLRTWTSNATPKDWVQLAAQDPEARLTQHAFQALVQDLTGSKDSD